MRVNKFMLEVGIAKKISQMLEPVYMSQQHIEEKMITLQNETLAKIIARVSIIEDDIYNSETRDDRLTRIEGKINECKRDLKQYKTDKEQTFNWLN